MAILPRRRFNPQTMMRNVPPAGLIDPEELGASAIPTPDNGYVPNYGGARPPTPDDIPTPGPMSAGMPPAGPIPEGPAMAQYKAALGENDKETPMWRQILGGALASTRFGRGVAPVVSGEMGRERRRRRVQSLGQAAQLEEQQRQHQANEGIRRQQMDLTGEQIAGARENRQMMGDLRSRQAETDAIAKGWRPLEPGEQAQPGMPTGTIGGRAGVYDLPGMRKREALAKQEAEQAGWAMVPPDIRQAYPELGESADPAVIRHYRGIQAQANKAPADAPWKKELDAVNAERRAKGLREYGIEEYMNLDANRKKPSVNVSGGGESVKLLADIVEENPGELDRMTPTDRAKVLPELKRRGFTGFGRPLSDGANKQIAESLSAVESLKELSTVLRENEEFIGPLAGLQSVNPYSDARKAQAKIDLVRQRVGKALEGGVLRKEDEEKYKRILATLRDTPSTAISKIDDLIKTMTRDIQIFEQQQRASGRRVPERAPNKAEDASATGTAAPIIQRSPSTGQYRHSLDGGKTWRPGKP